MKFDIAARIFSGLSLFGSIVTLFASFLPPERGIQFNTHLLLIMMFLAQLAVFVLFIFIGVILLDFVAGFGSAALERC